MAPYILVCNFYIQLKVFVWKHLTEPVAKNQNMNVHMVLLGLKFD